MSRDIVDTSAHSDRLVVAIRMEGEPADQLACALIEDPDVAIGDEELDRPAPDKHWIPLIGALRPGSLNSFRGFYTILFREQSGLVHATMRGLNHVTIDLGPTRKRVVLEAPLGESAGPYGMATVVYGVGLLVAAQALGWPNADEVESIFARFS